MVRADHKESVAQEVSNTISLFHFCSNVAFLYFLNENIVSIKSYNKNYPFMCIAVSSFDHILGSHLIHKTKLAI